MQGRGEQPPSKAPFMALLYLGKPAGGPIASSSNPLQASPEAQLVKNSPANARDASLIPGLVRSPGEGNGNPLQYSCLEYSMAGEPDGLQSMGLQRVRRDWACTVLSIRTPAAAKKSSEKVLMKIVEFVCLVKLYNYVKSDPWWLDLDFRMTGEW